MSDIFHIGKLVGKTIARAEIEEVDEGYTDRDRITIRFTDGSGVEFESWDAEQYASGINLTELPSDRDL